jgi:uncharacterized protein (DUF4415 family)
MPAPYRVTASERARMKRLPRLPQPPDAAINVADIPEASDAQLKRMKRIGRPLLGRVPRKAIAIRIDGDVLERLRRKADQQGIGYQTLINNLLAKGARS